MPIYEYRCLDCGDEFEVIQGVSARPLRKCRKCGGRLEKLISRTSFVLKGGGWYADGYSRSGSTGSSSGGSRPSSGGSSGGSKASGGDASSD